MTVFVDTTNKGTVNLRESPSRTSKILMHVIMSIKMFVTE